MNETSKQIRYTMLIQWSEEDQAYVVTLPEWGPYCSAYGATYDEAVKNAQEVLELLLDPTNDPSALTPPQPNLFQGDADIPQRFAAAAVERTGHVPSGRRSA